MRRKTPSAEAGATTDLPKRSRSTNPWCRLRLRGERVLLAAAGEGVDLDAPPLGVFVVDLTDGSVARD